MTTHSGSPCHAADARYVCFSTFFSDAAVGTTLVGLKQREYTAPSWKCEYLRPRHCYMHLTLGCRRPQTPPASGTAKA